MSYKQGNAYKLYETEMKNAVNLAKQGESSSKVMDYFVNNVSYHIAMTILESKGLMELFNKTEKKAVDGLMAKYEKYNPSEPIEPFKEDEEEYMDDVEAEPPGYKLTYEDDEVQVFEEPVKPKPKPTKLEYKSKLGSVF